MSRTADKNNTGQPGTAMTEVWHPNNDKFDDGIAGVNPEPGAKAPDHSPYYAALLKKHSIQGRFICIDCGDGFKNKGNEPEKKQGKKTGQRCLQCQITYQGEINARNREAYLRRLQNAGKVGSRTKNQLDGIETPIDQGDPDQEYIYH